LTVAPVVLGRYLAEHPYLVPTPDREWVSGLRLADGAAFTHELTAAEVASGMLSADDDLALWAQFAIGGLPLAGGGEVRATTILDLPPGIGDDLPAGQGMLGQLPAGPDGWLAFRPEICCRCACAMALWRYRNESYRRRLLAPGVCVISARSRRSRR
jgi:hypothetical protein